VHHRWITIAVTVATSALSLFGMNFVQQQFFPSSDHAELRSTGTCRTQTQLSQSTKKSSMDYLDSTTAQ
jgi:multidrug efflux pump subunit AcrB